MQARKKALIAGTAVALLFAATGWYFVGRWAYHRYVPKKPESFITTGDPARAPAVKSRSPVESTAVRSAMSTNSSWIFLGPFAEAESLRWTVLPKGLYETNGVAFFCDGAIRLNGLTRGRGKQSADPGAIVGIPVNLKGNRLHWLHASENSGGTLPGASYAAIVLHYEDDSTHQVDLRFNVHGRDWFPSRRYTNSPVLDPNSSVAWTSHRRDGTLLTFYHTIMSNPAPELRITSMDVISPLSPANVLLIGAAITSSNRPLQPSPAPQDPEPFRSIIKFTIKQDGPPPPGASATNRAFAVLQWTAIGPNLTVDYPAFPADSAGHVSIDVPLRPLSEIHYQASSLNGTIAEGTLVKDENGKFPEEQLLVLKKPVEPLAAETPATSINQAPNRP